MVFSCSKDYTKLSFLNQFDKRDSQQIRMPAKIGDESCFIDEFGIDRIKTDIETLEKAYTTRVEVPDKFKFTSLKAAETHYISRFYEQMYFSEESKSCDSLVCLLNIAYGNKEADEGYRIYHWFLTMGSGISTLDLIPGYRRDENRSAKDYLFPDNELKLLNMVSQIVSDDYRNILVSTLHRFPDGTSPGVLVAGQFSYSYGSKKNPGTIFLTDQDVRFDKNSNLVRGHYIHTVIHELSHALDFTFGDQAASEHFSGYEDWVNLSWSWGEGKTTKYRTVNGVREEYEVVEMMWIVDKEKIKEEGFVRGYQRTSHKEDFADSGANFVISASSMEKISPKKLSVISNKFYNRSSFLKKSELEKANDFLTQDFSQVFWSQIKECSLDEDSGFSRSSLSFPSSVRLLKPAQKNCIESKVESHFYSRLSLFRKENYQGCLVTEKNDSDVLQSAINSVSKTIDKAIDQIGGLDGIKKTWKELRENLAQNCSPVTIYLKNRKSSLSNYDTEIKACALDQLVSLGENHSIFDDEVESYIRLNSIDSAKKETKEKFTLLTKGIESSFESRANESIMDCRAFREEELRSITPIDGGTTFVQASVLNCINENFTKDYDQTIQLYLQGKYNLSPLGLEYISELYSQKYVNAFNKEIINIFNTEEVKYKKKIVESASSIFDQALSREETLIEYFRTKKLTNLKKDIEQKLVSYYPSLGGYPITISLNEFSNELVQLLENEVSKRANRKAQNEIVEVKKYVEKESSRIALGDLSALNWIGYSDDQFNSLCESNIKSLLKNRTYTAEINYYTQEKVKDDVVKASCLLLKKQKDADLKSFSTEYEALKDRFIESNLKTNWNWKFVFSKVALLNECQKRMASTAGRFNNSLFVNSQKVKAEKDKELCESVVNEWEVEKQLVSKAISCDCAVAKPSLSFVANNWLEYLDGFKASTQISLSKDLKEQMNKSIEQCKTKYPRPRYSLMRVKRKSCLLDISEKDLTSHFEGFDSLAQQLAKELIFELSKNIDTHLN